MTSEDLFHALERHRVALTERLDGVPAEIVARRPGPEQWSLTQIVDHLARIDRGLRLDGPAASRVVRGTSGARGRVLAWALGLPLRIPAPPGAGPVLPSASPEYAAVRDAWAERRADWRRQWDEVNPNAVAFRHPLMGPFVLRDALAFLLAHHRHHDAQVERTLAAVSR